MTSSTENDARPGNVGQPGPARSIPAQLSGRLVAVAAAATGIGIVSGAVEYLNRSSTPEHHSAGTAAWPVHLCLSGAALVLLVVARVVNHRRRPGRPLLLAPLGRPAAARLRYALSRRLPGRLALAALPLAVCVYSMWRVGEQVLGGLDPDFTANAWGGPSYAGAMYCHYLDSGLTIAAAATLLALILPHPPAESGRIQ